jgi:hypothetical protein
LLPSIISFRIVETAIDNSVIVADIHSTAIDDIDVGKFTNEVNPTEYGTRYVFPIRFSASVL